MANLCQVDNPGEIKYIEIYRRDVVNLLPATLYVHVTLTGALANNLKRKRSAPEFAL